MKGRDGDWMRKKGCLNYYFYYQLMKVYKWVSCGWWWNEKMGRRCRNQPSRLCEPSSSSLHHRPWVGMTASCDSLSFKGVEMIF
ncbi:hypothetical protein HanPI659440_Chr14g0573251 [Helianthus annuus]|nr:hypothetical protein HanPI659440_Chr14g0573251 [Helianthus annuus]